MKTIQPGEKEILDQLSIVDPNHIQTIDSFLEEFYFKDSLGRALVLQNIDQYAVFFLKVSIFDNELIRNKEIEQFFDTIRFLHYLNNEGYITIYGNDFHKIYIIQDDFDEVKIQKNQIILNARGYYTDTPKYICDKNGNLAYKGIVMKYSQYESILNLVTGNLIVSDKLIKYYQEEFKPTVPPNKVEKSSSSSGSKTRNFKPYIIGAIVVLSVLMVLFFSYYVFLQLSTRPPQTTGNIIKHSTPLELINMIDSISNNTFDSKPLDKDIVKTYYGIDISHYNGSQVSKITENDSLTFVICKATEGIRFKDPYFDANWNIIKEKNYVLGAYHFYHVEEDPILQAEFYIKTIESRGYTDIAPIVDVEEASIPIESNYPPLEVQKNLFIFLEYVKTKTKRDPIIYTGGYFANKYLWNDTLSNYRLWLADYTSQKPRVPNAWKRQGYFIWQKSDKYIIGSQHVDFDQYYGSITKLIE